MTQSQLGQSAQGQVDSLQQMKTDIEGDERRLRTNAPVDVPGVIGEIRSTVLVYMKDIIDELRRHRDWTSSVVEEVVGRLEDVEAQADGGGTQFLPEDAEKFKALAQGVDFLIVTVSALPGVKVDSDVAGQFAKLKALAGECLAIIEDSTLVDDDDDEGEEEEEEEDASRANAPS